MARYGIGEKVQLTGYSLYRGVSGTVKGVTEGPDEMVYSVDLDVGGIVIVDEDGLVRLGEKWGGTYSFGGYRYTDEWGQEWGRPPEFPPGMEFRVPTWDRHREEYGADFGENWPAPGRAPGERSGEKG